MICSIISWSGQEACLHRSRTFLLALLGTYHNICESFLIEEPFVCSAPGCFFFSFLLTLGVCFLTLPALARVPCCLPIVQIIDKLFMAFELTLWLLIHEYSDCLISNEIIKWCLWHTLSESVTETVTNIFAQVYGVLSNWRGRAWKVSVHPLESFLFFLACWGCSLLLDRWIFFVRWKGSKVPDTNRVYSGWQV